MLTKTTSGSVIEVKIGRNAEGGFDRLAMRISRFDEVDTCHLMSGGVRPPRIR